MKNKTQAGFTITEIVVVTSILIILIGLTTINVLHSHRQSLLTASFDKFIIDLKQQQLKAMTDDTEGRSTSDNYGIYFDTNTYTLFHGTYSASDPSNSIINLGESLEFSNVTFSGSQILFQKTNGEVSNFNPNPNNNTITLVDITNNVKKTITINRYGIITDIN